MEGLQKYPISIYSHEQDIIIDLIKDRKHEIPAIWQQLLDKKCPVLMNSFELSLHHLKNSTLRMNL